MIKQAALVSNTHSPQTIDAKPNTCPWCRHKPGWIAPGIQCGPCGGRATFYVQSRPRISPEDRKDVKIPYNSWGTANEREIEEVVEQLANCWMLAARLDNCVSSDGSLFTTLRFARLT